MSVVPLEEGIIAQALADATLSGLIGNRFYADTIPEGQTYPAGVFSEIGGRSTPTFDARGPQWRRFEFDFCGETNLAARQCRDAFQAVFDGFSGALPNGFALMDAEYIGPVKLPYDSNARLFWSGCEFYLKFNL